MKRIFVAIVIATLHANAHTSCAEIFNLSSLTGVKEVTLELLLQTLATGATESKMEAHLAELARNKLRDAGIRVIPHEECRNTPNRPVLFMSAYASFTEWDGIFLCQVELTLSESMVLRRRLYTSNGYVATSWHRHEVAIAHIDKVFETLHNLVNTVLGEFIIEVLKDNQVKAPP